MNVKDQWDNRDALITYLANLLIQGRLALFLGAGVSKFYGLPEWDGLINALYDSKKAGTPDSNRKIAAEEFRDNYYKDDEQGFLKAVHQALYCNATGTFEDIRKHKTLIAIGALVMASSRGKVGKLITLNYDDIVELYLAYHGFTTASIHDPIHWTPSVDVAVYHPHGFLPIDQAKGFSKDIVLDQNSYSRLVNDANNSWFQEISTVLRTHFTIYIGLSGDDENLDAMLVRAKDGHASVRDHVLYCGMRFSIDNKRIGFFDKRGIYTASINNFDDDIPSFLLSVCQKAAEIRTI